ncbi:putative protein N(5)-glutamine methyltransferase [Aeromicrobium sp. Leaf350]|uniref:putative protein N(5)-glutamine methyltransferase n=1 Tax=Aeromicrobium sp. Leaf350 TaxID=2876565 RepID=UPI001E385BBB|nr:putative protein N(5)-glutamine methyltransferase [Aeromicrobium sp. Leaf350]
MTDSLVERLRSAGCVFAEEEAQLLRAEATGARLDELVARRVGGEPLETVLGRVDLDGERLQVTAGCFVPRRRTLLLVRLAVEARPSVLVEVCCGVAPVAALAARRLDGLEVHAADLDPVPLVAARVNLGDRGRVHEGDLMAPLPADLQGRVDVLVANAPYVPTAEIAHMPSEARLHEPRLALDGGADGLDLHRRIAHAAPGWLRPGGVLLIETSERQARATAAACAEAGLAAEIVRDDELDATAVRAVSDFDRLTPDPGPPHFRSITP